MLDWYDLAEETDDVFGPRPKIAPQGQDGNAHFNYYDRDRALSFQWDGHLDQQVVVSFGGSGEPIKWTFDFREQWQHLTFTDAATEPYFSGHATFAEAALHFKRACSNWIVRMEREQEEPDDVDTFRSVFDETNNNWTRSAAHNHLFVKGTEQFLHQKLASQGHLFLNEVYDALGFSRTPQGATKGWISGEGQLRMEYYPQRDEPSFWITFHVQNDIVNKI